MLEALLQNEQFMNVVMGVLTLIVSAVLLKARQWMETQVGKNNTDLLVQFIEQLVAAAQQQYGPPTSDIPTNPLKKDYVLQLAAAYAQRLGLKLDVVQLEALIESAVFHLKQEQTWRAGAVLEVVTSGESGIASS